MRLKTLCTLLLPAFLAGCCCENETRSAAVPDATAVVRSETPAVQAPAIRIDAGSPVVAQDGAGNKWLADAGFTGGETVDRGSIKIANTAIPEIYRTEHWGMTQFNWPVPNGKYTLKLHFAETYDGITEAGQRVFSVGAHGQEIKDLDVFKEAGGANRALVKTLHVVVANQKVEINFTKSEQNNPEINGIEIIPE